jgi:ACR3 family arsenite transporter
MTISSVEGSPPTHTEPVVPEKNADLEKLQREEQIAVKKGSVIKGLGWLDRFLAVWILLAMLIGILLGNFVEETGPALQKGKFVGVSIPIAIGLLVMMYPILCKVRYETLHRLFRTRALWVQIAFSVFVNWIVAPLFMVRLPCTSLPLPFASACV